MLDGSLLRCGIHNELPAIARAFARRAHALRAVQFQMNQPALAWRHGIEAEGLACLAHALRGHARRKLQFFQTRSAIISAIESHAVVKPRVKPQPAMRHMLEGQEKLRVSL